MSVLVRQCSHYSENDSYGNVYGDATECESTNIIQVIRSH